MDPSTRLSPLRYATYLEVQAAEIPGQRSAVKTRLRLLAALARLLERAEFADIKVQDITAEAGLAKGTFFIYFKAKDDIVAELLHTYVEFERMMLPTVTPGEDPFDGVCQIVRWYEGTFAVNHAVLRCLIKFSNESTVYRDLWRDRNRELVERWTPLAAARLGLSTSEMPMLRQMVRSVGAIMDQAMFERYGLASTDAEESLDADSAAELHAVLLFRAIYGINPPVEKTHYLRPIIEAAIASGH